MDIHKNARSCSARRELMVKRVREQGRSISRPGSRSPSITPLPGRRISFDQARSAFRRKAKDLASIEVRLSPCS